jgi:hypothetical protein
MVSGPDTGDWSLPRSRLITKEVLDRAIATEEAISRHEYHARAAWYDYPHDAVVLILTDGRVFGAERALVPSIRDASPDQLNGLVATDDGVFLSVAALDLFINVDGLVTRLMEECPSIDQRVRAPMAGRPSAAGGQMASLVGRAKKRPKQVA